MEKEFVVEHLSELPDVASKILDCFEDKKVVAFKGEMGVGKTTLIKELCKKLGVAELTQSPTFSVVNEYLSTNNQRIYHFDFYRIENEEEAYDLGYEDYFYSGDFCFIEWPERIPGILPEDMVLVYLELDAQMNRKISVRTDC